MDSPRDPAGAGARALLSHSTLGQLLRKQTIVTVPSTATVDQTLRVLAAHRILSAPVVSAGSPSKESEENIAGFIDVRDVLSSFLHELDLPALRDAKMLKRMRVLEGAGVRFAAKSIRDLKALGSDGWFYEAGKAERASLREIVHDGFLYSKEPGAGALFGGTRSRPVVHRLALFNARGALTHVVSQSDVVAFLLDRVGELGALADAPVSELGLVSGAVVAVGPETPALDAMVLMEEKNISAVAVVAASGAIVGNFSISELRSVMAEHFGSLALPVGEFLALEHGTEYSGYALRRDSTDPGGAPSQAAIDFVADRGARRAPGADVGQALITCRPESTLREVLATVVRHRLHRVYVCDAGARPTGVITLTDVLRMLVHA